MIGYWMGRSREPTIKLHHIYPNTRSTMSFIPLPNKPSREKTPQAPAAFCSSFCIFPFQSSSSFPTSPLSPLSGFASLFSSNHSCESVPPTSSIKNLNPSHILSPFRSSTNCLRGSFCYLVRHITQHMSIRSLGLYQKHCIVPWCLKVNLNILSIEMLSFTFCYIFALNIP